MLIILIIILVIIKLFFEKYDNFNNIDNNNLEFKYPIKNVKPELVLNINSNICFIFFYTKNIADYAKHSLKNIIKYCEKHNYALQCFNEKFNDDVHPCWNKIASILKLIKLSITCLRKSASDGGLVLERINSCLAASIFFL